jgi:hypothetical protein
MKSAALFLVAVATAVFAQSPAPGTILMPYSLQGVWSTSIKPISEVKPSVVGPYDGCYTQFQSNQTSASWSQICQTASKTEVVVSTLSMYSPSTVACGQNQQLGQSYGVFGGYLATANVPNDTAVCVYFNRVDPLHLTNVKNAQAGFGAYRVQPCTQYPGQVCCDSALPNDTQALVSAFDISGDYLCASGVCNSDPESSYCNSASNVAVWQIGIGMSIGGIGLLIVTLGMILVISFFVSTQA